MQADSHLGSPQDTKSYACYRRKRIEVIAIAISRARLVPQKQPFLTLLRNIIKLPSFTSKSVSEVALNSTSD
jgi:hypothetical protein